MTGATPTPPPTAAELESLRALKGLLQGAAPELFRGHEPDLVALRDRLQNGRERYGLQWRGRASARHAAAAPPRAHLPADETLFPHTSPRGAGSAAMQRGDNLLIEGDNLDALKHLREQLRGEVRLIYIDPPYNTGRRFIYRDSYRERSRDYQRRAGESFDPVGERGAHLHSPWLDLLYPRLLIAAELLREDGVFLMSIDDTELGAAQLLLREIFGDENELAVLIWNKQHSQQQGLFKRYHEYVLAFAKDRRALSAIRGGEGMIEAGALKRVSAVNPASDFTFPAGVRFEASDGFTLREDFGAAERVEIISGELRSAGGVTASPVTLRAGWTQRRQMEAWFRGEEVLDSKGQRVLEFFFSRTGKLKYRKARSALTPPSLLPRYGMVSEQTAALTQLMGAQLFSNPKPVEMIADFIRWFTEAGDLVLDFFAGSGTTGHAAMRVSVEEQRPRRFILVQAPELLDPAVPTQRAAAAYCDTHGVPRHLSELTHARLKRAAEDLSTVTGAYPATALTHRFLRLSPS